MEERKTAKNRYGITIIQCCASCQHNKGVINEYTRICEIEKKVKPSSWCSNWMMKCRTDKSRQGDIELDSAGKGGGRVKRKMYLDFLMNYDHANGHKEVGEIQEEFEQKFGSIYLTK